MISKPHFSCRSMSLAGRQRGMALYVAMIMLLLVSLIGVSAMQVSNLQQRMAVNYNDFSMAFQRAEGALRESEFQLQRTIDADPNRILDYCVVNANAWGEPVKPELIPTVSVRELVGGASCSPPPGGLDPTSKENGDNRRFQLVAAAADRGASESPSAVVVVETIFEVPPAVIPPAGP